MPSMKQCVWIICISPRDASCCGPSAKSQTGPRGTIPVIFRIGQVQIGGKNFSLVILGRTGRTLVRRGVNGIGISLQGREQPHAAADHRSLKHRIQAALRSAGGVAVLVEKGLWSIAGSELRGSGEKAGIVLL